MLEPKAYQVKYNGDFRKEKIGEVYELYQKKLKENNALDFDDIINYTIKILTENPDVLEYYTEKFKYVLVDEYQDTNKAQFMLVSILASKYGNITVVGDNDQGIYSFRGADITNILNFEKDFPGSKIVKLEQNYRCTGNILKAANAVIKNNENKYDKKLWTENEEGKLPRTIGKDGKLMTSKSNWWTSGFFPGVLWYLYEVNGNDSLKMYAENYTKRIENQKYTTDNHDVGFMLYCSFGNGLRLTGNDDYRKTLLQGSESLSTRFRPQVGCIRSWDWNQKVWEYPVIIDNLMNLEMLMWASKNSDNPKFEEIAKSHADVTMKYHFRSDYSSYHVISYDTISGLPEKKNTCQGYAHESCWARGQGWALYGYTMMYRETGQEKYLRHAINVAKFIINHPRLPEDKIPYWDFDAPNIPNELRDASAGALMASAFIELSLYTEGDFSKQCLSVAETQLKTLSSPEYLAEPGTNCNFILKHSVGNNPGKAEVDVPLTYADYYYVEALVRYKRDILKEKLN